MKNIFKYTFFLVAFLVGKTIYDLQPIVSLFKDGTSHTHHPRVVDRNGILLSIRYQNHLNYDDLLPLHLVPPLLKDAFIMAEDKTFWQHAGIDLKAKIAAVVQNTKAKRIVRGASTITEQVVRILTNRPRTFWSKWMEMWEAIVLERTIAKQDILTFYINQIPFASHRRGVVQAAHFFFNRDLSTLTPKEMLALVVMVRAPSFYNVNKPSKQLEKGIDQLAKDLSLTLSQTPISLERGQNLRVDASHFVRYCREQKQGRRVLRTTLDATLQYQAERLLQRRIQALESKGVHHGALVILDHQTGEVLSWVVAHVNPNEPQHIDGVRLLRQPGSTLKPFLYANALEKGWTAATLVDDSPTASAVGCGLHRFRNFSNTHYGLVSVRQALGNSLNIPAIKAIDSIGVSTFLKTLHQLGFVHLTQEACVYDEGLALGNGEVTLLELVQAYGVLANKGIMRRAKILLEDASVVSLDRVFKPETTSIISDILADPWARRLEFGINSVVNLPTPTAVKTGTSTDFRDAWVVGYNHRYVVGIWMGNLDYKPMQEVTGTTGPAIVLRAIFALLNKRTPSQRLYMSPRLIKKEIDNRVEYFDGESEIVPPPREQRYEIMQPTVNLRLAIDPRIPRERQKFEFRLAGVEPGVPVRWIVDDQLFTTTQTHSCLWSLREGQHTLQVRVGAENREVSLGPVVFYVRG